MRVGFDELPESEAVRSFAWGDRNVFADEAVSS